MSVSKLGRISGLALVAATAIVLTSVVGVGVASAGGGGNIGPCPSSITSLKAAPNVGAAFTTNGSTATYTFSSWTVETQTSKVVPGLVEYCVYTTRPTSGQSQTTFKFASGSKNFGFVRPGGDKTNLPLDGSTITMGTATWAAIPASQTLVLHINDPAVCATLYGATATTCFVLPSPKPGPICNAGDTSLAYNALPYGVENCGAPSEAFQAQRTFEFGDEVTLKSGTGRQLSALSVVFSSYACETSGQWNTGDCVTTTPNATFAHPITANIYDPSDLTTPLASVTTTQTIPYRPSADPIQCSATPEKFFNAIRGACQNSIQKILTFTFPTGTTLPDDVVWTVAFNTSTWGYTPIGTQSCSATSAGCAYDSLNVATMSFPNAPYAGTDNLEAQAFRAWDQNGTFNPLGVDTDDWTGFRPLGAIATS